MLWTTWSVHVIFVSIGDNNQSISTHHFFKITFIQGANTRVQSSHHNHHPHRVVI